MISSAASSPGPIILLGSGETSASGQKVFDQLLRRLPPQPQIALLETPAGFELNSERVAGRVADFLRHNLQNYAPQVRQIPARQRSGPFGAEQPAVAAPLLQAQVIYMGAGSPTYAVRQLHDSLAWHYLLARHRLGAALVLASAAVISISTYALPVYEIYKVGEELHWKPGLDLFGTYGLPLVFVPHWNNNDGGSELDTSRCFMGRERFDRLMQLLPAGMTVFGIDENTALWLEPNTDECQVIGKGGVTLIHTGHSHAEGPSQLQQAHIHEYRHGERFTLHECCPLRVPEDGAGLPEEIWLQALSGQSSAAGPETAETPPPAVLALLEQRASARAAKDWVASDVLRAQIAELGWKVLDSKTGQKLEKIGQVTE